VADRVFQTEAVVLHRSDVGEHDRLLRLATPLGRRRCVARGVRKMTSRLAGHIEPFTHLAVQLAVGRSRDTLTQSQVLQSFPRLHAELDRLGCAYYSAELYERTTAESDDTGAPFALLVTTLAALDEAVQPETVLRAFELQLLTLLGYQPLLQYCPRCEQDLTPEDHRYSQRDGGVVCHRHAPEAEQLDLLPATFRFLRHAQRESPRRTAQLRISPAVADQARAVTASALRPLLERELQSRKFLAQVLENDAIAGDGSRH
jgi:DNA repair protein RecO (recombination protein O)